MWFVGWSRARARAGMPPVGPHRLRHRARTGRLRAGASLAEIGQVLRHRERKTTAIYAKCAARRSVVSPAQPGGTRRKVLGSNGLPGSERGKEQQHARKDAPRGALLYPRRSREELEGRFLGLMAYPDPKGERDNSMPANRRSSPGVRSDAPWDPRDMAKATLPKPQSPEDARHRPPERHPKPAPRPATTSLFCRRNLRSAERDRK